MQAPLVVLLVITYDRYDELKRTLDSLIKNVRYDWSRLQIVVSDDSTGGRYLANLRQIKRYGDDLERATDFIETPKRMGWGAHVNHALRYIKKTYDPEYVFQIEDDYVVTRPIDLFQGVGLLEERPNIGMLRYRGTSGAHFIYHQFEAKTKELTTDAGKIESENLTYLQLDNASHSLYVYSHGAHLKRVRPLRGHPDFHTFYGAYPEGLVLGKTEESYAHQVKDRMKSGGAPAIAILPDWINMRFAHIGKSRQGTSVDIGE